MKSFLKKHASSIALIVGALIVAVVFFADDRPRGFQPVECWAKADELPRC